MIAQRLQVSSLDSEEIPIHKRSPTDTHSSINDVNPSSKRSYCMHSYCESIFEKDRYCIPRKNCPFSWIRVVCNSSSFLKKLQHYEYSSAMISTLPPHAYSYSTSAIIVHYGYTVVVGGGGEEGIGAESAGRVSPN